VTFAVRTRVENATNATALPDHAATSGPRVEERRNLDLKWLMGFLGMLEARSVMLHRPENASKGTFVLYLRTSGRATPPSPSVPGCTGLGSGRLSMLN
jgi:hypothetical protein